MFSKIIVFFLAFFSILAVASPGELIAARDGGVSQCNTGNASCCNLVQAASSNPVASLLGLLGIVVQDITALIGLGCTPITGLGLGQGANCAQQPVCCTDVQFNGLINIGCTPISL